MIWELDPGRGTRREGEELARKRGGGEGVDEEVAVKGFGGLGFYNRKERAKGTNQSSGTETSVKERRDGRTEDATEEEGTRPTRKDGGVAEDCRRKSI